MYVCMQASNIYACTGQVYHTRLLLPVLCLLGRINCSASPLLSLVGIFFDLLITLSQPIIQSRIIHPGLPLSRFPSIFHSTTVLLSSVPSQSVCPILIAFAFMHVP